MSSAQELQLPKAGIDNIDRRTKKWQKLEAIITTMKYFLCLLPNICLDVTASSRGQQSCSDWKTTVWGCFMKGDVVVPQTWGQVYTSCPIFT